MGTRQRSWAGLDEREFYWLWLITVTTYGVGDTLTTLALVEAPHTREANAVVAAALQFGGGGLAALKITALVVALLVSAWAAHERDRFLYYLPPFLLSTMGTFVTVHNARLLWF